MIEIMIAMVIGLILLGALLNSFVVQSGEYKYLSKRSEAVKEMDWVLRYMASDMERALIDSSRLNNNIQVLDFDGTGSTSTSFLRFSRWSPSAAGNKRVVHEYTYTSPTLSFNPEVGVAITDPVLGEIDANGRGLRVTNFRVFQDGFTPLADRALYADIPPELPTTRANDSSQVIFDMPSFTIMLEVEIDAIRGGAPTDVLGNPVQGKRRVWRYIQVYPRTLVPR